MKVAVLFSGGKDSTYSLYLAEQQGREVVVLLSITPFLGSAVLHKTSAEIAKLQARALNKPIILAEASGTKESELKGIKSALAKAKEKYKIEGIVSGVAASEQQRYHIEAICADLGLKTIFPLWRLAPEKYMREQIRQGFEIIFSEVAGSGFDKGWLGRRLDSLAIEDLKKLHAKFGISISGEESEYRTLVLDGPNFSKKLGITKFKIEGNNLVVEKAKLVNKNNST
ncbi:MAG: diphthine--ammonia ligase [DPANN group archaeon]|nr:diphthine--ammonia ligase [DPANN group archaeon]